MSVIFPFFPRKCPRCGKKYFNRWGGCPDCAELKQIFQQGVEEEMFLNDSNSAREYVYKGCSLIHVGKNKEAISNFDRAINAKDCDSNWYYMAILSKGVALENLGKNEDAIKTYNQGIDAGALGRYEYEGGNPHYAPTIERKSMLCHKMKLFSEALKCHNMLLEFNSDLFVMHFLYRGICEENLGKKKEAIISYEKYIDMAPPEQRENIKQAKQFLSRLKSSKKE